MNIQLDSNLINSGIDFKVHYKILKECSILKETYDLSPLINSVHESLKNNYTIDKIKTAEIVQKYRNFSWHFLKLDPTKNRPSGEALGRRLLNSKKIPKINPFVDAYNLASAETLISLSAYDLEKITTPISIRFAEEDMVFDAIGGAKIKFDGNEIILIDGDGQIITQYLYRDADATKVTDQSRNIIILVNSVNHVSESDLINALERTESYLEWMRENGIIEFSFS